MHHNANGYQDARKDAAKIEEAILGFQNELYGISNEPSRDILQPLQAMLAELEDILPTATSGEVLSSRVKW